MLLGEDVVHKSPMVSIFMGEMADNASGPENINVEDGQVVKSSKNNRWVISGLATL